MSARLARGTAQGRSRVALAWNVNVLPRTAVEQLLEEAGFTVLRGGVYERFQHRVDQAILRDLLLAQK